MAVLRRRRREDVRYLRRSPATKQHHIHSKRLLLLAHLHQPCSFPFPAPCSRHQPPATCPVLEVARAILISPSLRNDPIALRATCDPRRISREWQIMSTRQKPLSIYRAIRVERNNVFACPHFAHVNLIQSDKMLNRYSCLNTSENTNIFLRDLFVQELSLIKQSAIYCSIIIHCLLLAKYCITGA